MVKESDWQQWLSWWYCDGDNSNAYDNDDIPITPMFILMIIKEMMRILKDDKNKDIDENYSSW